MNLGKFLEYSNINHYFVYKENNNIKNKMKYLVFYIIFILTLSLLLLTNIVNIGSATDIYEPPSFKSQPLSLPTFSNAAQGDGDILVDNFEYWDTPLNHGWTQTEPDYPLFGFGIGYSEQFSTVMDFQEGSRVLEVSRPANIMLIGTEYERHYITKNLVTPPTVLAPQGSPGIDLSDAGNGIFSFKFRAPLGIEDWDTFNFALAGYAPGANGVMDAPLGSVDDIPVIIEVKPVGLPFGDLAGKSTAKNIGGYEATLIDSPTKNNSAMINIKVNIGRNFNDGSWHVIWLDLQDIQATAYLNSGYTDTLDTNTNGIADMVEEGIAIATMVRCSGQAWRMDDIIFREEDYPKVNQPDMYEIGPLYAQLFESYRYLFMADYQAINPIPNAAGPIKQISDFMLDMNNFITDPMQIRDAWIADLTSLDPTHPVVTDPTYADRWFPGHADYGTPDPVAQMYTNTPGFYIDATLPVFSDPDLRIAGNNVNILQAQHGILEWKGSIGGYRSEGTCTSAVQPLPIDPRDGMPTYIPAYYSSISAIKSTTGCCGGSAHYGPNLCLTLESALWNSGMKFWPNIAYLDYTPQVMENLIVTIEVSDGRRSDVRTIPLTVVNYPVENYSPVVQVWASPKIFYVGKNNEYMIKFIDPDSFIFSLAQFQGKTPATTHVPGWPINDISEIRNDQDNLTFQMTINDLPSYQYGPWTESLIDQKSGLISFTPQFEGKYRAVITCRDDQGAIGIEDFPLTIVEPGTWLNHAPIFTGCPTRPIVIRAGEEAKIATPDFIVTDVDGDQIYTSCNIGACGQTADGGFIWTFQTNYPGIYNVEWVFFDVYGGYTIQKHSVDVQPWWSK